MKKIISFLISAVLLLTAAFPAYAQAPEKPEIAAAAGTVINADTGEVLFAKDADTAYYPASITKTMTALLVMEKCSLDEKVKFSKTATTNLESGAVTINMTEGDVLTVNECMHALMLKSANEVANGLAEHTAGSISAFADMMNAKAKALGCTNTHFVNPNGLNNQEHYTTAHDMALIAAAAFSNPKLREIDTAKSFRISPTKKNPDGLTVRLNNKILMEGNEYRYPYAIAGKTGYTSRAGSTLVTYAERDGVHLAAVVLKSTKYMGHYTDTKAMLEYGFAVGGKAPAVPPVQNQTEPGEAAENTAAQAGPGAAAAETAVSAELSAAEQAEQSAAPAEAAAAENPAEAAVQEPSAAETAAGPGVSGENSPEPGMFLPGSNVSLTAPGVVFY